MDVEGEWVQDTLWFDPTPDMNAPGRRYIRTVLGMLPSQQVVRDLNYALIDIMFEECEALPYPGKPQWYPVFGGNDEDDT